MKKRRRIKITTRRFGTMAIPKGTWMLVKEFQYVGRKIGRRGSVVRVDLGRFSSVCCCEVLIRRKRIPRKKRNHRHYHRHHQRNLPPPRKHGPERLLLGHAVGQWQSNARQAMLLREQSNDGWFASIVNPKRLEHLHLDQNVRKIRLCYCSSWI